MRSDNDTALRAMARQPRIDGRRSIRKLQRDLSVNTLHILKVVLNVFQVKDWLLGSNLQVRSEDGVPVISRGLCCM